MELKGKNYGKKEGKNPDWLKNGEVGTVNSSISHSSHPDDCHMVRCLLVILNRSSFYSHFPKQTCLGRLMKNS